MPAEAILPDDELWRPWADLPLDLLREISRRLHATTDYIRFHATCKPWRDSLPPAPCYPTFLPWLLAPPDSAEHQKARCVFSYSKSTRRGTGAATQLSLRPQRRVISLVDGTEVFTLTTSTCSGPGDGGLVAVNHVTGSDESPSVTPLPPLSPCDLETKWWVDHADGLVSSDGTILLYFVGRVYWPNYVRPFSAALLRPGHAAWTMVHAEHFSFNDCRCIAHYDGKIIAHSSYGSLFCIETRQVDNHRRWDTPSPSKSVKAPQATYLLESRGELLLANVLAKVFVQANDCPQDYLHGHTIASFVDRLSVSVYALQEAEGGKKQWVKKDGRSFTDRIMFLGMPSSFSVDAARFGVIGGGGCAYFVLQNWLYGAIWSKFDIKRCRVFKYSFQDDRSELIEQLPAEWDKGAFMWLTPPQPSITSTEVIKCKSEIA